MKEAVRCPVCEGSGKYKKKKCHGCAGSGWVTIGDGGWEIPYYNPVPVWRMPYRPEDWYTTCTVGTTTWEMEDV